jgi:hypothetical protein
MINGFIETTVLTNLLLKLDGTENAARDLINKFDKIFVPQFSWKEFKRGPLSYYVWFHNKIASTDSFEQTLSALQRMSMSPRKYLTATAIQAIHTGFVSLFSSVTIGDFNKRYDANVSIATIMTKMYRLEMKRIIFNSWSIRNSFSGGMYHELSCYPDSELKENSNIIDQDPRDCPRGIKCCLLKDLIVRLKDVESVRNSIPSSSGKKELIDRRDLLRSLYVRPSSVIGPKECRKIGDAYFVIFCPQDFTIITTNIGDIKPMADALGIDIVKP